MIEIVQLLPLQPLIHIFLSHPLITNLSHQLLWRIIVSSFTKMFKLNSKSPLTPKAKTSLNMTDFYDQSDQLFISQLSPIIPSSPSNLIDQTSLLDVQEQFRQTQECLETSAAYMQEIDSFFHELSTNRPTPVSMNTAANSCQSNWLSGSASNVSFQTFDFDSFNNNKNGSGFCDNTSFIGDVCAEINVMGDMGIGVDINAIDPSMIFNIQRNLEDDCDFDDEQDEERDPGEGDPSDQNEIFNVYDSDQSQLITVPDPWIQFKKRQNPSRLPRKRKPKLPPKESSNLGTPSSDNDNSTDTTGKCPKFYSRSGQVADPTRGPCHNCHTTLTCYWRKLQGKYHCNACTLFFKRNKHHRNINEVPVDKPIKRRKRKSKYEPI